MFKKSKKASIIIYIVIIINLSIVLGWVVYDSFFLFSHEIGMRYGEILKEVNNKSNVISSIVKQYNSNGNGYLDSISCPSNIIMSGTTMSGSSIPTELTIQNGIAYCIGDYNYNEFRIYFNNDYTNLEKAYYNGNIVYLNSSSIYSGNSVFDDTDSTLISFTDTFLSVGDNIDDNLNSDNYGVSSTGNIYYPDNYEDDDALAKKEIFGYILPNTSYYNVFWNNYLTNTYISDNIDNNSNLNLKIGDVTDAVLYFDINNVDFDLKIVEFDRNKYINEITLLPLNIYNGEGLLENDGYLQLDSKELYFSKYKTGNEFIFDFKNKDYGIFILNNSQEEILYNIKSETSNGTGVYINPINDSGTGIFEVFSNYIVSGDEQNFIGNNFKILYEK